jgi:uncharacterized protein YqgC (DUF456 family)
MDQILPNLQHILIFAGWAVVIILCVFGIILSSLTISGTWLVVAASAIAAFIRPDAFPSLWITVVFAVISGLVELLEAFSGAIGVKKRGGSAMAGFAAVVGGFGGIIIGSILIPVPLIGGLIGMIILSFAGVFLVEAIRIKKQSQAAYIATGAVLSRIFIMFVKIAATLVMTTWLTAGILLHW